jgi:2,3-bisphosphoglycerate-dependent phosphoglycerate mutase
MSTLVLLRHGESQWNVENRFTGWVDVDLTAKGEGEAVRGGEQLLAAGVLPDVVHTSLLRRAIRTSQMALNACDRHWVPTKRSWRLNERHYGDLQGKDKAETLQAFGEEQFLIWRRSFDVPPPAVSLESEHHPSHDVRYANLPPEVLPATECLKDVLDRMLPYWHDAIVPDLRAGQTVLVVAHGNSFTTDEVVALNIPTGMPLKLEIDDRLVPTASAYLDPEAAAAAAHAVANQGKK